MKTTNKKRKLTPEELSKRKSEQKEKRLKRQFKNKIKRVFILAGFSYINSENHHFDIGLRTVEIDALFFFENIVLVCEDTCTSSRKELKKHIRNKHEAFEQIEHSKKDFLNWIESEFTEYTNPTQYNENQVVIKYLYFSQCDMDLSQNEIDLYPLITFVEPRSLEYLSKMAKCIRKSIRYEVFRFLKISDNQIGANTNESSQKRIEATIISPQESTGLKDGVRIVSFMMSAETLIKNAYVLRKDNWEETIPLYQRLIQEDKIKNIRKFLAKRKESFYNNIIVALPEDIFFLDENNKPINIDQIGEYGVCSMIIPDRMNSICVIDGQHRIYAHYEGEENDKDEPVIAELRKKLHLLVTGLVFPEGMSTLKKIKLESEIFLDINSNAKPVAPDILLHIKEMNDPLSDIGLARAVIEKLNRSQLFSKKFELSSLDSGKIKIASIIKFALRYLVSIDPKERKSFYSFWEGDKESLKNADDNAYEEYIGYCTCNLETYFSAIKNCLINEWNDPNSKILSVISINGFIIAYNRLIDEYGMKDYNFFNERIGELPTDFSKKDFPYTSSQYKKFSSEILEKAFLIDLGE